MSTPSNATNKEDGFFLGDDGFSTSLLNEFEIFKLTYRQQVAASRDPKDSTFGGKTMNPVSTFHVSDAIGYIGIAILVPWSLLLLIYLAITMLPTLIVLKVYLMCQPRPTKRIKRGVAFTIVSFVCFILNLPVIPFVVLHAAIVILVSWIVAIVPGFFLVGPSQWYRNWKVLGPFLSTGSWYWGDIIILIISLLAKHKFLSFYIAYTCGLVAVPLIKFFFVTNPFMHVLDEKYCNQWTPVLKADHDTLYDSLLLLTSVAVPTEEWTNEMQDDEFSVAYQCPPPDRDDSKIPNFDTKGKRVTGGQFFNGIPPLCFRTNTFFSPKGKYPCISQHGKYNVLTVVIYYFNPLHFLTGNVEVNVRHDHRFEHPMWLLMGDNSQAIYYLNGINDLFLRFGYQVVEDFDDQTEIEHLGDDLYGEVGLKI